MSRTPKNKQNKKPLVIEEQKEEIQEESPEIEEEDTEEEVEQIQAPKKVAKPRTDKQLEQLKKAREKAIINKEAKRKEREKEQEEVKKMLEEKKLEQKKALEQKIVKKAISIKKKDILKQAALDTISDDETPIQKIKEIAKKKNHPAPQPEPVNKFIFV